MPYRNSLRMRPVNSLKHIIDTNGNINLAVQSVTDLVFADPNPDPEVSPSKVTTGSTVSSVYLRVEVSGTTAAGGVNNVYMAVVKNPGNQISFATLNSLGISNDRKWVIHQEMVMTAPQSTAATAEFRFPRTLFQGVIRIPPRMRRFGVDDKLQVLLQHRVGEATQQTDFCLQAIYKEFR